MNKAVNIAIKIMSEYIGKKRFSIDCYDLVVLFYKRYFNIDLPDYNYDKKISIPPDEVWKLWEVFHDFKDINIGDVIVFESSRVENGIHLAVYLGNNYLFHSHYKNGPMIENINRINVHIRYYARLKREI